MIGPFSTTLIPLSSSSSVDRQVLINVEASAISPDERTFGFIFTKIPVTRRSDEEKKGSRSLDQIARTFSLFAPPPKKNSHQPPLVSKTLCHSAHHALKLIKSQHVQQATKSYPSDCCTTHARERRGSACRASREWKERGTVRNTRNLTPNVRPSRQASIYTNHLVSRNPKFTFTY